MPPMRDLLEATGSELLAGSWLNAATERYPAVVLGATTAERLGIAVWARRSGSAEHSSRSSAS